MELSEVIDDKKRQASDHFLDLNSNQLNWKSEPGKWSIGQCLDHLIVSNKTYFNSFDKLLEGSFQLNIWQKLNPFKKALGPMMVNSLSPQSSKTFTAPKVFEPSSSEISSSIVHDFLDHQEILKSYFSKLSHLDTIKIVIASPVSSIITYTLADAMQIISVHEQRHLNQAIAILNHPNFPKS